MTARVEAVVETTEQQHFVEQFLDLLDKDIEAGRSIGDLPAALEQSMLARLGKPLGSAQTISGAVEI